MNQRTLAKILTFPLLLIFASASPAWADETALLGKLSELQKNMEKMQKTIEYQSQQMGEQKKQIDELQKSGAKIETTPAAGVEAAPSAAPMTDYEFGNMLDSQLGGSQKWLKGLKFSGDLRLRYEAFANHGTFSDPDRNRFRFRLRYGFEKGWGDQLKAGFSFASGEKTTNTGHNGDPTSTNQTMGNDFNFKNIWIEKAYATYLPNWAKFGPIDGVEFTAGKFNNPFEKGASDLIFDRDLKPEGAYETVKVNLLDSENVRAKGYFTAGQYILQESGSMNKDAQMFGYQLGINPVFYTSLLERPIDVLSAISFYDYQNYNRQMSWRIDQTAAGQSLANGNSVCSTGELCTGFHVLQYYNEVTVSPYGIPITPFADVAHNFQAGRSMRDRDAWSLGLKVGKQVKKGDWQAQYQYKWLGADALPGAFTDSDFGYNGYNGHQGSIIKLGYMLTDYLTLNTAAFVVRNLNIGSALDATSRSTISSEQQSRFQVDLVWKF